MELQTLYKIPDRDGKGFAYTAYFHMGKSESISEVSETIYKVYTRSVEPHPGLLSAEFNPSVQATTRTEPS